MNENELTKELQDIMTSAKKVNLSMDEKAVIRNRISAYATANLPVPRKKIQFFELFSYKSVYLMPALAILLVVSGGTSFLAEKALPGDTLYGIKINLNENIESMLAISPEAKAEVDLRQAAKRLNEAETLTINGDFTEVQSEVLQSNLSKKVESLNKNVEKVKKDGKKDKAEKVEEKFEKEIDEHFDTFVEISSSASNSPTFAAILNSKKSKGNIGAESAIALNVNARSANSGTEGENNNQDGGDNKDEPSTPPDPTATTMMLSVPASAPTTTEADLAATTTEFTMEEVSLHSTIDDCWTVSKGEVFDLTNWIKKVPQRKILVKIFCGIDATSKLKIDYRISNSNYKELKQYKIGELKKS